MANSTSAAYSSTWEEIDHAESYLVSCMFEEATLLASSIIMNLRKDYCEINIVENSRCNELDNMYEAAGMVFVQSMRELQRTSEILKELKLLFGLVISIPVQVFLTGVCFQISEGPSSDVQEYLEEFLSNWRYMEGGYYCSVPANVIKGEGLGKHFSLDVDPYLEVVELYVVRFLGMFRGDIDLAISWIEKSALPEEKRQELLRRLYSMHAPKATCSSHASVSSSLVDTQGFNSASVQEQKMYNSSSNDLRENSVKETIMKLSGKRAPCFWWFRTITLKFGNKRLILSNGKILLGCLLLFTCYFVRRKQAALKRVLRKRAVSLKKALVDLWQLAFSYQVNPLAAVQPLPAATRGSR